MDLEDTIISFNTSKAIYEMLDSFFDDEKHIDDGLWKFFTDEFGKKSKEETPCSDNMFLNFAHSSFYALLDFIYHIICIPLASIACFVFIVYSAIDDDNHSITDRILFALTAPLFTAILLALALTLALPTRLISSVVSPIVKCAEDALQEPATLTI